MKKEPAAAGRGARRRGTPLSILGLRVGAVAWGSPEKKLDTGGLQGWPGRQPIGGGECFRGGWGDTSPAAGGRGLLIGRWWLAAQGVEVEDELQTLDFISNGCKID